MPTFDIREVPIAASSHGERSGFLFSFGAYGDTHVAALGSSLEDCLEAAIEWLDDNAPGLLTTVGEDDYRNAAEELGVAWQPEEQSDADTDRVVQHAEQDMTMVTWTTLKHGNAIPSWEWTCRELDENEAAIIRRRNDLTWEES